MKRYYICPVITTVDENGTSVKAKLKDYNVSFVAEIPNNPDGTPKFNWALAVVTGNAVQHTAILADAEIEPLPHNDNPDLRIEIPELFRTFASGKGVSINNEQTLRELVTRFGLKLSQNFNFERFFVGE